jgi:glycerol-3-phosphate acyltransferase PlsY
VLDTAKGLVAISLVNVIFEAPLVGYYILAGSLVILGHFMPVWLNWKGGKVVATSLGVLLGLMPWWFIFVIISVFVITVLITKKILPRHIATQNVALGSMFAAISAVIVKFVFGGGFNQQNFEITIFIICIALLILIAHRSNIKKILQK